MPRVFRGVDPAKNVWLLPRLIAICYPCVHNPFLLFRLGFCPQVRTFLRFSKWRYSRKGRHGIKRVPIVWFYNGYSQSHTVSCLASLAVLIVFPYTVLRNDSLSLRAISSNPFRYSETKSAADRA